MASRAATREGHSGEERIAKAMSSGEAQLEPSVRTVDPEPAGEPIGRILASLDKLGARIRALSAEPEATPVAGPKSEATVAAESRTNLDLKRAVEEITRKRDAIDRRGEAEPPLRVRAGLDRAEHVQSLLERALERRPQREIPARRPLADGHREPPRASRREADPDALQALNARLDTLAEAVTDNRAVKALHEEVSGLKDALQAVAARDEIRSLEATYDALVGRLDEIRGAVDNPRVLGDLVQRMAEVRRLLAAAPTEAHIVAVADRIDTLGERLDKLASGSLSHGAVKELEQHVIAIAKAVGSLDAARIVEVVDARLGDLVLQVSELQARLPADAVRRITDLVERQTSVLSQMAERSDQLPRVAIEMERQTAGIEKLAESFGAVPVIAEGLSAVRDAIETEGDRNGRGYELLVERLDALAESVQASSGAIDRALLDQIGDQFVEILRRLDRVDGPPQEAILAALEDRFEALVQAIDDKLATSTAKTLSGLNGTLARIEQQIATAPGADRFDALEDRIAEIAAQFQDRTPSAIDLSGLEREIAQLGTSLEAIVRTPVMDGVEAEIRQLANRIDTLSRPTTDTQAIEELVLRLAEVVDQIGMPGPDLVVFADALERIEHALADGPDEHDIAETAARVATAAYAEMEGRETVSAIAQVQRELDALQSDIRAAAKRDRELLVSINATLDRLVLSATPVQVTVQPEPGPTFAPETKPAPAERWTSARAEPVAALHEPTVAPAAEAMPLVGEPDVRESRSSAGMDPISKLAARLRAPADEPPSALDLGVKDVEELPELAPLDLVDDTPLEPGSGKPATATATAKAKHTTGPSPSVELDPFADLPKAEPSKADFIAAARRAAQAAAGEASGGKREAKPNKAPKVAVPPVGGTESDTGVASSGPLGRGKRKLLAAAAAAVLVATLAAAGSLFLLNRGGDVEAPTIADASDGPALEEVVSGPEAIEVPESASVPDDIVEVAPPEADITATTPSERPQAEPAPESPAIPPAALPDSQSMTAEPLGPASSFTPPTANTGPAATAPLAPMAGLPAPPDAVGPAALRDAATGGDTAAQFEIAARLTEGRGVEQDLAQAAIWYEAAARGGLAAAQYRLGSFFEKGQGVPRDLETAMRWYTAAAEQGNVKAMHNVAVLYAEGGLGEPDYGRAADWFEKASNHGLRDSQYNLGILYARGLGVPRDLTASYKWFALAAAAGDADAAKKRDDVAQTLEKDVLARARLAVETWSQQPEDPAANDVDTGNPAWSGDTDETASIDALPDITRVQILLDRLGYDVGPADGQIGARTRNAIRAFQKANGLAETGEIDGALVSTLGQIRL